MTPVPVPEVKPAEDITESDEETHLIKIGVAAMDRKARSKPMRNILSRLVATNRFECIIFGDKVIMDEDVEHWPVCDFLISFFSTGFPMDKAIRYVKLRKPISINDLPLQKIFWDRRLVLAVLDRIGVPTPTRLELSRDGGPRLDPEVASELETRLGIKLNEPRPVPTSVQLEGDTALIIDGKRIEKPFVEKPVSGEDHNINIYFGNGMGGRRLFRKIANQSSTLDPDLCEIREEGSYVYEEFMKTDNSEDIKIYTLGPDIVHAETRKSPVVDGIVKRNLDGKEIRYIIELTPEEREIARRISCAFSQNICGFDILRVRGKSYVIDVNGWSFVKGNDSYYDKCADTLSKFCLKAMPSKAKIPIRLPISEDPVKEKSKKKRSVSAASWCLKGTVCVFRHADRTPKNKLKFNFLVGEPGSDPFIKLLQGRTDEIILRTQPHLKLIANATDEAFHIEGSDRTKLDQLKFILNSKMGKQGLKAQLKPSFSKTVPTELEKMNIVVKWGGEFTHAARYQSRDIGQNFAQDLKVMSKTMLDNVTIFSSSESRVVATAEIFSAGILQGSKLHHSKTAEPNPIPLIIRKDLLDDSNAAKEPMDKVKKRLKVLLRHNQGTEVNWPIADKEPVDIVQEVIVILKEQREIMNRNWEELDVDQIQSRWCCGECPFLFKERWEKLFSDWCDGALDPSRVCELYDSLKYDSLHNRTFLETIFSSPTYASSIIDSPPLNMPGSAQSLVVPMPTLAPSEYGIEKSEKREIGLLTSLPLLQKILEDLNDARESQNGLARFYFTKESHMHTLVNLIKMSSLKLAHRDVLELDYMSYLSFEVYERVSGECGKKEHSVRISLSEGAHGIPLDTSLDAKHALQVIPRRQLIPHTDLDEVIATLEDWGEDLAELKKSTTPFDGFLPVEGEEVFLIQANSMD
ncbi:histidine phosphatase superfamily-domain-containing protein [Melampsora americana]|nr:histidine phosphatase superfamily-domain-containing protein [Melampsora americana]